MAAWVLAVAAVLSGAGAARALAVNFVPLPIGNCGDRCPTVIAVSGEFKLGDAQTFLARLQAEIQRRPGIRPVVLLHSPGGNLGEGLNFARVFRAIGARVIVARVSGGWGQAPAIGSGTCASACVFAMMGGVSRVVPEGSRAIVHWVSEPTPMNYMGTTIQPDAASRSDDADIERLLRAHMRRYGVNTDLVNVMRRVPNSSGYELTTNDLRRYRLATRTFR
jgi:hypothetical protein